MTPVLTQEERERRREEWAEMRERLILGDHRPPRQQYPKRIAKADNVREAPAPPEPKPTTDGGPTEESLFRVRRRMLGCQGADYLRGIAQALAAEGLHEFDLLVRVRRAGLGADE